MARIDADRPEVLRGLIRLLQEAKQPGSGPKWYVVDALAALGPRAKEAVPLLIEVWKTDREPYLLDNRHGPPVDVLFDALHRIDPEAAAKAGVRR